MSITKPVSSKFQFFLVVIAVNILVISAGILYYNSERNFIRNEKFNELKAIADLKVNQIEQWHNERLSEVQFFSQNEPYIEIAKQVVKGDYRQKLLLRKTLSHILTNTRYKNIYIVNKKGELVFSVDTTFSKLGSQSISFSKKVYETKKVIFSDLYYSNTHNAINLDIGAPIINSNNEVFATLVFRINPNDNLYPLIQNWPTPSKTAETLLVRKDGDSVQFLNKLRHVDHIPLKLRIPLSKIDVPAVQAIMGHIGIFEGIDYRGVEVLSKIQPIKGTPWFMVAKVDREEIFAELYFRSLLIVIISSTLILLFGASVAWLYHYRQRNIYKKLLESELELHQSQEEFRATLYSIGDGVITTDKKGNVKQLNPVAEALTGWKEANAKGKKLEEVFIIINEDTRGTVESPVTKVLKEGLVVGLANHTLLISKNGTEIPIADSGAPIKNKKGEIDGVVMVFRDQTEERNQQKELIRKEERFHSTLDNMLEGCQIINFNWEYLYINNAAETHNKRPKDELLGKRYMDMWPGIEATEVFRRIKLCLEEKIPSQMVNEFVFPNGTREWFELNIQPIPEGVFILSIDITQRKKDSEELCNQKLFLQELIENSGALVYVKDTEGRYELVNRKWEEVTGLKRDAVIGNTDEILFPGDVGAKFRKMDVEVINAKAPIEGEETLENAQGIRYFISIKFPLLNREGNVTGVCGMSTEITQRKKDADELNKSKAFIQIVIENLPIGIAVNSVEPAVSFEFMNENFARFYGVTKNALSSPNSFWETVYEDVNFREEIKSRVLNDIASGDPKRMKWFDIPIKRNDEIVRYITARNIPLEDRGLVISTVWDVTEQKLMEESIRESEIQFRQLVDNAPQGIFVQTDGMFAYINPIALKLFGAKNYDELVGTSVIERFHPNYRELVKQRINQLNNEKKNVPLIQEVCLKIDGTPFDTEVSAVPINYLGKNGALVFFQDITERKKADNELLALKNELEVKVKEKTKELNERVAELERFHDATIDREIRMKELRDELKRLKGQ